MRRKIKTFESERFGKLRVTLADNGEPLFCAKDLCRMLGFKKTWNTLYYYVDMSNCERLIVEYEKLYPSGTHYVGSMLYINVTAVGELLAARTVDGLLNWICDDVIAYLNAYGLDDEQEQEEDEQEQESSPDNEVYSAERLDKLLLLLEALDNRLSKNAKEQEEYVSLLQEHETLQKEYARLERESKIWELQKEALNKKIVEGEAIQYFLEKLNDVNKTYTATEVGQYFGLSAFRLNQILEKLGVLRRVNGDVVLTARYVGKNYAEYNPVRKLNSSNEVQHLKWTVKGLAFICSKLKEAGYTIESEKIVLEDMEERKLI